MKLIITRILYSIFLLTSLQSSAILNPIVDSIPMSDGRKLAADVYIPSGITNGPVILIQLPYNRLNYRFGLPLNVGLNINSSNYIFVIVDWRGFYGSKKAAYVGAPALGDDGYSTVQWIAQQTWSNGKVGTWGPSALGRVQFQTAQKNPPNLTCICPLVAGPQYDYTEYFPNGCLRTEYVEQLDGLGFGMSAGIMPHPIHDATWTFVENANYYPTAIKVPALMIGGWYDHTIQFMLPFFNAIQTQSPVNVRNQHRLLMGPWVHGGHGAAQVGSGVQGQLTYNNAAGWEDSLALLFFDYHLRSVANGWDTSPVVNYYQMGENTWKTSATWPPAGPSNTDFYFHNNGTLDNSVPTNSTNKLSFNYDPTDPSPTVGGPTLRTDQLQGPYDQKDSVEKRNDILIFSSNMLTQNVVLKGSATVHLKVSSDRKDTDFDLRLTDVYPDGRSMLVNDGVMRMRFRNGNTSADTAAMVPGTIYDCNIALPNTSITFLAGHKIRIDVTSSNYPRFNRNMNSGGKLYPGNSMDTLVNPLIATNTVYTNSLHASYVTFPLVNFTTGINVEDNNAAGLNLYPNPANDKLFVNMLNNENKKVDLSIYNTLGQQVLAQDFSNASTSVDVSQLKAGIYFVYAKTNEHTVYSQKIAITR
jgi:predicted acyl esterase